MNRRRLLAAGLAASVAGCADRLPAGDSSSTDASPDATGTTTGTTGTTGAAADGGVNVPSGPVGYTFTRPDGNRVADAPAALPGGEPVDVPLDAPPVWIAGVPVAGGSLWVAVGEASVTGVRVVDGEATPVDVAAAGVADGAPPALVADPPRLLSIPGGSDLSHPTLVPAAPGGPALVGVDADGAVVVADGGGTRRLAVDALPDARVVTDGRRAVVLSGATDSYGHGVLGDRVEATRVTLVTPGGGSEAGADGDGDEAGADGDEADADADGSGEGSDAVTHRPVSGGVIEGLAPVLVDGDPLVTVSDADAGARLALATADGLLAGPAVGRGYRWRHQLAVAPFGPGGEPEFAAVRTPHIGGVAEFYRRADDGLERVATRRGYSAHAIGSRNLDAALAGDLDGDGAVELLVPAEDEDALAGLRRVPEGDDPAVDGVAEAWRLSLPAAPTANLAGVAGDGSATVGVGLADRLRVWPSEDG
jgi:hypothetical protein